MTETYDDNTWWCDQTKTRPWSNVTSEHQVPGQAFAAMTNTPGT